MCCRERHDVDDEQDEGGHSVAGRGLGDRLLPAESDAEGATPAGAGVDQSRGGLEESDVRTRRRRLRPGAAVTGCRRTGAHTQRALSGQCPTE